MEEEINVSHYINALSRESDRYGNPHLPGILEETGKIGLKDLTLEECKEYYIKHDIKEQVRCDLFWHIISRNF